MQHLIVNSGFDAVCNEKKVDRTRPTGLIWTSPEFRFGIMEWVTNWTFTITQTHFLLVILNKVDNHGMDGEQGMT